jgi:hypothetical protein
VKRLAALALTLLPAVILSTAKDAAAQAGPGVKAIHAQWKQVTGYIQRAAEQMPESEFGYRPVSTVRTFGQLVGHVAGAQRMICAAALNEPQPAEDDIERSATTKAALVAAIKTTSAYCERAYAQTDLAATAQTTLFGAKNTRLGALALNSRAQRGALRQHRHVPAHEGDGPAVVAGTMT